MNRAQKEETVTAINKTLVTHPLVVVCHYKGLTVSQLTELRTKLIEQGGQFKVIKNRLAKLAAVGTEAEGLNDLFAGPTGIAYSADPVAAAKIANDFAKDNENLVILGGKLDSKILDVAGVEALAKLPSLDELRSKIIGVLQAPASKVVGVLQAPASQLARVTAAYGAS